MDDQGCFADLPHTLIPRFSLLWIYCARVVCIYACRLDHTTGAPAQLQLRVNLRLQQQSLLAVCRPTAYYDDQLPEQQQQQLATSPAHSHSSQDPAQHSTLTSFTLPMATQAITLFASASLAIELRIASLACYPKCTIPIACNAQLSSA